MSLRFVPFASSVLTAPARLAALLVVLLAGVWTGYSGEDWFPLRGRAAIHQRCLDLEHPAVVMVVALQPGYEDLPLLAYLRAGVGVKTVTVYLTNGEGTPGDSLARFPLWMTGVRKEEADHVATMLGSESWFANLPDIPGARDAGMLATLWDTIGVEPVVTRAIRTFQPDAIILCADHRVTDRNTMRENVALAAIRKAMKRASTTADTSVSDGQFPWSVSRLFVQRKSEHVPSLFSITLPALKTSPMKMAEAAALRYRTLRLQIGDWVSAGREYVRVDPDGRLGRVVPPEMLVSGVPEISQKLGSVAASLKSAIHVSKTGLHTATLSAVAGVIENTEHVLASTRGKDFTTLEKRLMVTWKNGLEDLRCAVLGVSAQVVPSESLLTASQVWFLDVKNLKPKPAKGTTDIIFPRAMKDGWVVNEKSGYHFPLKPSQRFEIITPQELPFVYPVDMYGLHQPQMKTTFPYLIVHKDPSRERNFILRGVLSFTIGPRRTFTVHTPLIYDDRSSPVIFEMQNFSRDAFKGVVSLMDSTGETVRWPVEFTKKDEIITDTLYLTDDPPPGEGNRLCTLELSGRGGRRSVTARRFTAAIDSTVSVEVLSTIDASPLVDAMRVLRQPYEVHRDGIPREALDRTRTIILDRDVLADPRNAGEGVREIGDWIRKGGHAVVLPQTGRALQWLRDLCGATFEAIEPLPPDARVEIDSSALFGAPNRIGEKDWDGWVESRAFDEIRLLPERKETSAAVRSGDHLLVCRIPVGEGFVTLVATDLLSQLVNYHPGAFRLLANIIADGNVR